MLSTIGFRTAGVLQLLLTSCSALEDETQFLFFCLFKNLDSFELQRGRRFLEHLKRTPISEKLQRQVHTAACGYVVFRVAAVASKLEVVRSYRAPVSLAFFHGCFGHNAPIEDFDGRPRGCGSRDATLFLSLCVGFFVACRSAHPLQLCPTEVVGVNLGRLLGCDSPL